LKFGLGFANCIFHKSIYIQRFRVIGYSRQDNHGNNSLFFNNCKGIALVIRGNVQLHRALLIENECVFKTLSLSNTVSIGNGGVRSARL